MDLIQAPPTLTNRQRAIVTAIALVCAVTRFLAVARSLWEWDEVLFCLGLRSYDVASHQPHPPGFPVFIAMAKFARVVVGSDFRALQSVVVVASLLVFPAMFLFARELRLRFTTCVVAATFFAFLPNVWFFGGTAFSDVPSIVLVLFAVAMLLRGCRDANAYLIGSLLLALAIGIRPQNFVVGLVPGILATWHRGRRSFRDVAFAALVGIVVVVVAFGAAAEATGGLDRYLGAIRAHGDYISAVDSFRSPSRPPLWRLFDRFFLKQYGSPLLSGFASVFVVISVIFAVRTRDRSLLVNVLTFAPFALSAWLMLDRYSISRFSIGYAPMFAVFVADGVARVARGRDRIEAGIGAALVAAFVSWTLPALGPVRNDVSPPVQALQALRERLDPRRDLLFVVHPLSRFVDYYAPYFPYLRVQEPRAMPLSPVTRPAYLLSDVLSDPPRGLTFTRERGHLWNIARRHYFEIELRPLTPAELPHFGAGWHAAERSATDEWRWMEAHSTTTLPAAKAPAKLRLEFFIPPELIAREPTVTVALNGRNVARFTATSPDNSVEYDVTPAPNGAPNVLDLATDRVVNPQRDHGTTDPRDLGLRVRFLSFGAE